MAKAISKSSKKSVKGKVRVKAKGLSVGKKSTSRAEKAEAKLARKSRSPVFPRGVNPNEVVDPAHAQGHRHVRIKF